MKNFEKHMLDIIVESGEENSIVACYWRGKYLVEIEKEYCAKHECKECYKEFYEWLNQEHKEVIKITEDEKAILRNLPKKYKWIARDEDCGLYLFEDYPYKTKNDWDSDSFNNLNIYSNLFKFIKWSDAEPYSIEELLKEW